MLLNGTDSDVTIEVKGKKFTCHRCMLRARSPVFFAMMNHEMEEKASGVITIKDAEPTVFQDFIMYIYTGNKEHVNWKNLTEMYMLGDKYGVKDLKSLCVQMIRERMTIINFYNFFILSQRNNDSELKDVTVNFFVRYAKEIVVTDDWKTFLSTNIDECNTLINALANK